MYRSQARSHTTRTTLPTTVAGLAVLLALTLGPSAAPLEAASRGAARIAGTWEVLVEPDPQSGVAPVVNVATFTRDGKIVNVDPGLGTAVGGWENQAGSYAVTFHGFLETGGQTFRYRVRATVVLDGSAEQFSGPFVTEVQDLNGNPILSFEGTVTAHRLPVEPY